MTATDVLRRLLDERGVEWENSKPYGAKAVTRFKVNDVWLRYVDYGDYQWLDYHENEPLTPAQAIAATLGSCNCSDNCTNSERTETCRPREVRSRFSKTQERVTYYCECGHELGGYMTAELPFPHTYNEDELPNYCPNCGRRIAQ